MAVSKVSKEIKTLLEMVEDQQHMKNPQSVIDQRARCLFHAAEMNQTQLNFMDEVRFVLESGLEWNKK